jgi:hypothetical protein
MHTRNSRSLLALFLIFTCLSFAVARTSVDGKVKFPADDPSFSVEFPRGWTYQPDKDGHLDCDPGDGSDYTMSILILEDIKNAKELRTALPKLAKSMADGAEIKKFELGDVETDKNGNGISFTGIRGDGKVAGVDFVVLVHGFEPRKGKFYAIVTAGSRKSDKKHEKAYESITASIESIK